jgi:solute carrier family 25 carnitine/acylcarnitine transporter 20/29
MKSEGPLSLYKGTVAPLLGNMVLLGIHFPTFHKTRDYLEKGDAPGTFTPWKILASGAAAGAAGSVVSSPTELIRTKMQVGGVDCWAGVTGLLSLLAIVLVMAG